MNHSEADLYKPIKSYFENLGYEVKSEIKDCDAVAIKDDKITIIEMKLHFNISLVFQGMDRQKITNNVFLAVPRLKGRAGYRNMLKMEKLAKRLGLGLIIVSLDSSAKTVTISVEPNFDSKINGSKKKILLKEFEGRTFDLNIGGVNKKKITTAYKENLIKLLCLLEYEGESKASNLVKKYRVGVETNRVMYNNFFNWFEKGEKKGYYKLSEKGLQALEDRDNEVLVNYYRVYVEEYNKQIIEE